MTTTPSRSPLGVFYRSPLGVRTKPGGVELYRASGRSYPVASFGNKIWQVPVSGATSSSLPVNFSTNGGRSWNRDVLSLRYVAGDGTSSDKNWEYNGVPILSGKEGCYCVAAANERGSVEIFNSSDLKTWTRTAFYPVTPRYDNFIPAFAWSPAASLFVCIFRSRLDTNFTLTSPDGINWTKTELSFDSRSSFWNEKTGYFYKMDSYTDWSSGYPVVYSPSKSTDGINWASYTAGQMPSVSYPGDVCVGITPYKLTGYIFGQPQYSIVASPDIYTSTDGVNWSVSYTASQNLSFCCSGGGVLIAGHGAADAPTYVYYSSDGGSSWNSTTLPDLKMNTNEYFASPIRTRLCTYAGGKFWLGGSSEIEGTTLYSSSDGATWTKLQSDKCDNGSSFYVLP